ncbi:hypothetical protein ILUMI_02904 [Ignelater luminosus]|uniref:DUF7041 domain-containing protein n=1 Tax=Ignelater luminosus TaxID=2038154 RepID=A0A8K0DBZ6_IGNLU|nr:hypothetical protein ILUMI_02904 [Ignelater luminosus]
MVVSRINAAGLIGSQNPSTESRLLGRKRRRQAGNSERHKTGGGVKLEAQAARNDLVPRNHNFINNVSIEIPPFRCEKPKIWLSQFTINRITTAEPKSNYLVSQLEPRYVENIWDIIQSSREDKYSATKKRLLNIFKESTEGRSKLVEELEQPSKIFSEEKQRMRLAYKDARTYNLKKRHVKFQPGKRVWKVNTKRFSAKLTPKFIECFICRKLTSLVYELQNLKDKFVGHLHIKDLKPVVQPSGDLEEEQTLGMGIPKETKCSRNDSESTEPSDVKVHYAESRSLFELRDNELVTEDQIVSTQPLTNQTAKEQCE